MKLDVDAVLSEVLEEEQGRIFLLAYVDDREMAYLTEEEKLPSCEMTGNPEEDKERVVQAYLNEGFEDFRDANVLLRWGSNIVVEIAVGELDGNYRGVWTRYEYYMYRLLKVMFKDWGVEITT